VDAETVRAKTCEECGERGAEILLTERSTDSYGQPVLEIVSYACSDCSEDLVADGYRETPVADVDPDVVEVEIRRSGDEKFVIKKRDSDGEWLKTDAESAVDSLEARR
jgi:DNA-directed RNA polymerase subunit RPC12/RpoP